jgi:AraC family transcriptional regulator, transcriptional activator of pobA
MENKKGILTFEGLYGEDRKKHLADYIFLEAIATRSKYFDWNIKPHVHTQLFQIFLIEKGSLIFQESTQQKEIISPCVIFIPPTNLHGLVYSEDINGQILSLSETIIEDIFRTSSTAWQTFEHIRILNDFEDNLFEKINSNFANIGEELFSEQPERPLMLQTYITQLIVLLHRLIGQTNSNDGDPAMLTHFRKFKYIIKKSNYLKTIPEIAAEIKISAVHLNRICNTLTGKSAIEIINQKRIEEAQKYLLHTSYSISEIAYQLDFEYPNYFAKLFKKLTGITPMEFRNKAKEVN